MIVLHDPTDETILHADSVQLAADPMIEMRWVSADGRRLLGLRKRGQAGESTTPLAAAAGGGRRAAGSYPRARLRDCPTEAASAVRIDSDADACREADQRQQQLDRHFEIGRRRS